MNFKNEILAIKSNLNFNNIIIKSFLKLKKSRANYININRKTRIIFNLYKFINASHENCIRDINFKFFNNKKHYKLNYIKSFLYYFFYDPKL